MSHGYSLNHAQNCSSVHMLVNLQEINKVDHKHIHENYVSLSCIHL